MPFVFVTLIVNSFLFLLLNFSAFDVIKYSAKSKPSNNSKFLLSVVIFSSASKLEPISLLALFSSIAILASCLILKSCFHFSSKTEFSTVIVKHRKNISQSAALLTGIGKSRYENFIF